MNTSKPISAISYNSLTFLKAKLEDLTKAHVLDFWAFIHHTAESDETKDHIHVYMEPARRLQTALLREEFYEHDPVHPDMPLGLSFIRSSKFGDWYLYSQHDPSYLALKGQTREIMYDVSDFVSCGSNELLDRVREIDMSEINSYKRFIQYYDAGLSFADALRQGLVPAGKVYQVKILFDALTSQNVVYRNGRQSHDQKEDQNDR